jgi:hypothetical protein
MIGLLPAEVPLLLLEAAAVALPVPVKLENKD